MVKGTATANKARWRSAKSIASSKLDGRSMIAHVWRPLPSGARNEAIAARDNNFLQHGGLHDMRNPAVFCGRHP
jgi:hypothetical protein